MQLLNVTNLPIYLPYDTAPLPFGDPFSDTTATNASPAVFTTVGYAPVVGDAVAFSVNTGGNLDSNFTVGQRYFVVAAANNTYSVSATKGGSAINAASSAGTLLSTHLLSAQKDGTTTPFKSGANCVVLNLSGGTLVLQGAPDSNTSGQYGNPQGPGTWVQIASLTAGTAALVSLNNDWIRVSTAGTLALLQN